MSAKSRLSVLEERLAALQRTTEDGFAARAEDLRACADRLEGGDASAREELRRLAHKLRGIAGSIGHPALSERAARLETAAASASDIALALGARRLADAAGEASRGAPDAEPVEPAREPKPAPRLGCRVVALDDEPTTRRLLAITLTQVGGCVADVVDDPARAMELIRGGGIELFIVDAMMPDVSGLDLYRAIRRELGGALPIAILSAATAGELGWSLPEDPRLIWLRKPFRPAQIVDQLAAFLRRA